MRQHGILIICIILLLCLSQLASGTTYNYDNLHRLTRVVYDNGTVITYTYDEVGNRTKRVSTLIADASVDGTVNLNDFSLVALRWLETDCGYPDEWCDGADIDWNTEVGIEDLALIAQQWLDTTP